MRVRWNPDSDTFFVFMEAGTPCTTKAYPAIDAVLSRDDATTLCTALAESLHEKDDPERGKQA